MMKTVQIYLRILEFKTDRNKLDPIRKRVSQISNK